jgi:hypothetical protein
VIGLIDGRGLNSFMVFILEKIMVLILQEKKGLAAATASALEFLGRKLKTSGQKLNLYILKFT